MHINNVILDILQVHTWVIKPTFGREGQNIQILEKFDLKELAKKANSNVNNSKEFDIATKSYLHDLKNPKHAIPIGNNIYQAFSHSEKLDDKYITIGSWTVNGVPVAITVRASESEILQDENSYFYPHLIHFEDSIKILLHTENKFQSTLRWELYGDEVLKFSKIFGEFYERFEFEERRHKKKNHHMSGYTRGYSSSDNVSNYVAKNSSSSNDLNKSFVAKAATGSTSARASSSS
jgi:hypothetical protein